LKRQISFAVGTAGVAANVWLVRGFLFSPLLTKKTHLLMLNLTVTCLGRGLLAGFPFTGSSILAGRFVTSQWIKYKGELLLMIKS
jgi:hypothetical protein